MYGSFLFVPVGYGCMVMLYLLPFFEPSNNLNDTLPCLIILGKTVILRGIKDYFTFLNILKYGLDKF